MIFSNLKMTGVFNLEFNVIHGQKLSGSSVSLSMTSLAQGQSCRLTTTGHSSSVPLCLTLVAVLTHLLDSPATPIICTQLEAGHQTPHLLSLQKTSQCPGLDLQGWSMAGTSATNQMSSYIKTSAGCPSSKSCKK